MFTNHRASQNTRKPEIKWIWITEMFSNKCLQSHRASQNTCPINGVNVTKTENSSELINELVKLNVSSD